VSGHSFVYISANGDLVGRNTRQRRQYGFIPFYTVQTDFLVIQASTRAQNGSQNSPVPRLPLVILFRHAFCLYVWFYDLFCNIPQMSVSQISTYSSSGFSIFICTLFLLCNRIHFLRIPSLHVFICCLKLRLFCRQFALSIWYIWTCFLLFRFFSTPVNNDSSCKM
jgi:hypothetical protein